MKVVIPAPRQKNILIRTNSISSYLVKNKRPIHRLNAPIQEVTIGSKQRVNQTSLNAVGCCGHLMAAWQTVINACCVFGLHERHILSLSLRRLDDSMYESRMIEIKLSHIFLSNSSLHMRDQIFPDKLGNQFPNCCHKHRRKVHWVTPKGQFSSLENQGCPFHCKV